MDAVMGRDSLASIMERAAVEPPATIQGRSGRTTGTNFRSRGNRNQTDRRPTEANPRSTSARSRQGTVGAPMRKQSLLPVVIIAVIMTGCSGAMPPSDGTAPTGSPPPATSPPNMSGTLAPRQRPATATAKEEVQVLFDTMQEAFRAADAGLLRSTMPKDLALLCPAESMEPWLLENGPRIQAFELASVFIDAEDPDRGMAQLALLPERDQAKPLDVESARWFPLTGSPFPLRREEGHWKAGYPVPQEFQDCPYQLHQFVPSEPAVGPDYPNIPGLDFNMWDIPFRSPEPDSPDSESSMSFRGSRDAMYNISSSTLQATDLTAVELISRYRERLALPGWNIREQGAGALAAWFTWTVHDEEGHLWHGALTATAAGEGWQSVSLFLHSPELRRP